MKTVPLNSLKAVLKNEVFPVLEGTEPVALAYAASVAANEIDGGPEKIVITFDLEVYKGGVPVVVPNTNGQRGNLIKDLWAKPPKKRFEIRARSALSEWRRSTIESWRS